MDGWTNRRKEERNDEEKELTEGKERGKEG